MRLVTALCLCVCCILCALGLRVTITQSHTHTYNATKPCKRQWPGVLKPNSYSLVKGNWSIVRNYSNNKKCFVNNHLLNTIFTLKYNYALYSYPCFAKFLSKIGWSFRCNKISSNDEYYNITGLTAFEIYIGQYWRNKILKKVKNKDIQS